MQQAWCNAEPPCVSFANVGHWLCSVFGKSFNPRTGLVLLFSREIAANFQNWNNLAVPGTEEQFRLIL
jgi:hypothetical protein